MFSSMTNFSVTLALSAQLCFLLVGAAGVAPDAMAAQPMGNDAIAPRLAHLEVAYAPSLKGTEAMFAVRVCARGERPGADPVVRETLVDGNEDIVVRVVDGDGTEISRYAGSTAVCDFAKFAAAVVARKTTAGSPVVDDHER
jgi:hypothetical protein